jgi:hypothetical protein
MHRFVEAARRFGREERNRSYSEGRKRMEGRGRIEKKSKEYWLRLSKNSRGMLFGIET